MELGSPNNIIDVPKVSEDTIQFVDENMKRMVVEFAKIYVNTDLASDLDQLINIFMTQPGFEKLNYTTLKNIIGEEKYFMCKEAKQQFEDTFKSNYLSFLVKYSDQEKPIWL